MYTIGERLRHARKEAGMTQNDTAAALGVSRVTVSHFESGAHQPQVQYVPILADLYGVSDAWILRGKEQQVIIYLAGRYERRTELAIYRDQIHNLESGLVVKARWLDGDQQNAGLGPALGIEGECAVESNRTDAEAQAIRETLARHDYEDVQKADLLIAFTEEPSAKASRGGRHVELGLALAWRKHIWVVGPRENIFCHLQNILQYPTWADALRHLEDY